MATPPDPRSPARTRRRQLKKVRRSLDVNLTDSSRFDSRLVGEILTADPAECHPLTQLFGVEIQAGTGYRVHVGNTAGSNQPQREDLRRRQFSDMTTQRTGPPPGPLQRRQSDR